MPGATGYIDTDYEAKGRAAVRALDDYDLVVVHVEAPDESAHQGMAEEKVKALERIDQAVVGPLLAALRARGDYRILVAPDHATLVRNKAPRRRSAAVLLCRDRGWGRGRAGRSASRRPRPRGCCWTRGTRCWRRSCGEIRVSRAKHRKGLPRNNVFASWMEKLLAGDEGDEGDKAS